MTTLHKFQHEIEDIHNRETAKQRVQAAAEKLEKENKNPQPKGKAKDDGMTMTDQPKPEVDGDAGMAETEEKILVCDLTHRSLSTLLNCMALETVTYEDPCRPRYRPGHSRSLTHPKPRRVRVSNRCPASARQTIRWRTHRRRRRRVGWH